MDSKMLELARRAGADVELELPPQYARYSHPGSMLLGCYDQFAGRIFVLPPDDMPPCIQDPNRRSYYLPNKLLFERVVAHELIHWTGDAARLNRLSLVAYCLPAAAAYEEGVAEAGMMLLMEAAGFRASAITTLGKANVAFYAAQSEVHPTVLQRDARVAVAYLNQFTP